MHAFIENGILNVWILNEIKLRQNNLRIIQDRKYKHYKMYFVIIDGKKRYCKYEVDLKQNTFYKIESYIKEWWYLKSDHKSQIKHTVKMWYLN